VAERHGCLLVKIHHSIVGFPDRLLLRPGGTVAFVEFKRHGEQPTKIQAYWHGRLRAKRFQVEVVRRLAHFEKVLTPATELCRIWA
jgi:hypothetical protein